MLTRLDTLREKDGRLPLRAWGDSDGEVLGRAERCGLKSAFRGALRSGKREFSPRGSPCFELVLTSLDTLRKKDGSFLRRAWGELALNASSLLRGLPLRAPVIKAFFDTGFQAMGARLVVGAAAFDAALRDETVFVVVRV